MKIAVVQYMYGNNLYYAYSQVINRYYCSLHGYDYIFLTEKPREDRHINWHKIEAMERFLQNCDYDYVLFLDGDAHFYSMSLTIEKELIPLLWEDGIQKDLLFAVDILQESKRYSSSTPNSGVVLLKVNDFTRSFYSEWNESSKFHDLWKNECPHLADQPALIHVLYPKYAQRIKLTKEYYLMNAVYGQYIRHYAATSYEYRITQMKAFVKEYLPEYYQNALLNDICSYVDNNDLPFLSVCCPTYKRPKLLAEFYDCFLKQDYPINRRELIILDDAGQFVPFEDKENRVRLISLTEKYSTIGEKRNAFLQYISPESEFYVPADDDDLYYPHWLRTLAESAQNADVIAPIRCIEWKWQGTPIYCHSQYQFLHAAHAIRLDTFRKHGGYPNYPRQEDRAFFIKLEEAQTRKVFVPVQSRAYFVPRRGAWDGKLETTEWTPESEREMRERKQPTGLTLSPKDTQEYFDTIQQCFQLSPSSSDGFEIIDGESGFDKLRINSMGFFSPGESENYIYAHAPSWIHLRVSKVIRIYGATNASSHGDASCPCKYKINGKTIGFTWKASERTRSVILSPGDYQLAIETKSPHGCHTLWKIDSIV